MFTQTKKKLYFNITWAGGVTAGNPNGAASPTKFIPCTPFRPSVTIGDRYGSLLQALEALTGNSPNSSKAADAVTAVFVPSFDNVIGGSAVTVAVGVDFVAPTLQVTGNNNAVPLLPYLSLDGSTVARNRGKDVIYGTLGQPRHFSVRLRRIPNAGSTATLSGVLYVARQLEPPEDFFP